MTKPAEAGLSPLEQLAMPVGQGVGELIPSFCLHASISSETLAADLFLREFHRITPKNIRYSAARSGGPQCSTNTYVSAQYM